MYLFLIGFIISNIIIIFNIVKYIKNKIKYNLNIQIDSCNDSIPITRYYYKSKILNNTTDKNLIIILQNPSTKNNKDRMTKFLCNHIKNYRHIYIINIIPFVEKNIENINIANIDILNYYHEINLNKIKKLFNQVNNFDILLACGQHFTRSEVKLYKFYEKCFIDILNFIKLYKNNVYCLGFTKKRIIISPNEKILLPIYPKYKNFNFIRFFLF